MSGGKPYAVVVGSSNMDVGGIPFAPLIMRDSNPGRVVISPGGVGRNIAHNLRLLGAEVSFVTVFGDDPFAEMLMRQSEEIGIHLSGALHLEHTHSSTYLYITGPEGDMELGLSDMEACARFTPELVSSRRALLEGAALIVADANSPAETIRWLAENCFAPLLVDPVSVTKAPRLLPAMHRIHTVKANALEAQALTGVDIHTSDDLERAASRLLEMGAQRVFITLGAQGAFAADRSTSLRMPCYQAVLRGANGAGDSFTAAVAKAMLDGLTLADSVRLGMAASAITIESEQTVSDQMSLRAAHDVIARRNNGEQNG